MALSKEVSIAYSAHTGSDRDNLGDVLSAVAISEIAALPEARLLSLPADIGKSKDFFTIYGGGGMVRPNFASREVFADYSAREGAPYAIYGVGLNRDVATSDFSEVDIQALTEWMKNAKFVTVRDWATLSFIKEQLGLFALIAPCPTYASIKMRIARLSTTPGQLYKLGVTLSLGHTKVYSNYQDNIISLTNNLLAQYGRKNVLLICHDEADYSQAQKLWGHNVSIAKPLSLDDVATVYSSCASVLTFRGHGLIFAAAAGIPCVPVLLNEKLATLYAYHYAPIYFSLTFDINLYIEHLKQARKPIDIQVDLSVFNNIHHIAYEEKVAH